MDSVASLIFGFVGGASAFIAKEAVGFALRQRLTTETVARSICVEVLFRLYSLQETLELVSGDLAALSASGNVNALARSSYHIRKPSLDPTLIVSGFRRLSTIRLYHGWRDEHEYFEAQCAQLSKLTGASSPNAQAIENTLRELQGAVRRGTEYGWGLVAELWSLLGGSALDDTLDRPDEFLWKAYALRPAQFPVLQAYYRMPEVNCKPHDPNQLVLCDWASSAALERACESKEIFTLTLAGGSLLPAKVTVWPYYTFVIERSASLLELRAASGRAYNYRLNQVGQLRMLLLY